MNRVLLALLALAFAVPAGAADAPVPTTEAAKAIEAATPAPAVPATADAPAPAATATATAAVKKSTSIKDKAVQTIDAQIATSKINKTAPNWRTSLPKPNVATFDPAHTYLAHMKTNKGMITIKFLPEIAPMHVTSFMYLTKLGFYDGLSFHRVITNFMAQGGDPLGTGSGGPGYQFDSEFSPKAKHDKGGKLSMANAGQGTDGSQFFLTFTATPWLDGKHTIFGEIIEGMDVLKVLEAAGSQSGRTSEPLKMEKVTIEVK